MLPLRVILAAVCFYKILIYFVYHITIILFGFVWFPLFCTCTVFSISVVFPCKIAVNFLSVYLSAMLTAFPCAIFWHNFIHWFHRLALFCIQTFTSTKEIMYSLALVCLLVNYEDYTKTTRPIFTEFD